MDSFRAESHQTTILESGDDAPSPYPQTAFCVSCGAVLPAEANYCASCGAPINQVTSEESSLFSSVTKAPPLKHGRFYTFATGLAMWGNVLGGYVVGPLVFILVLAGILPATGASPGGVLSGTIGAVLSFGLHTLWGFLAALTQVVSWLALLLIVVGLVSSIRRRAPWYTALLGIVVFVAAAFADGLRSQISEFFGSASPWDAAAFWAALAGTYVQLGARLLLWGNEIWNWPCRRDSNYVRLPYFKRLNVLHSLYMGSDTSEGFGKTIVSTVDAALLLAMCLVGWQISGWLGVAIGIAIGATVWGIARGLLWIVGGTIVSVCIVLPLSSVLALWEPDSNVRAELAGGAAF
jgi:hypothetical protein